MNKYIVGKSYALKVDIGDFERGDVFCFGGNSCELDYSFFSGKFDIDKLVFTQQEVSKFFEPEVEQMSTKSSAESFLLKAAQLQKERGEQYDSPEGERSMGKTVIAFNTITGHNISESEGWLLLQLLKDVRQWSKKDYHEDSAEDCIAYAALKAEALASGK